MAPLRQHTEPLIVHHKAKTLVLLTTRPADVTIPWCTTQRGRPEPNHRDPRTVNRGDITHDLTSQATPEPVILIQALVEPLDLTTHDRSHNQRARINGATLHPNGLPPT